MNLRPQLQEDSSFGSDLRKGLNGAMPAAMSGEYHALKETLHNQLLGRIDLEVMGAMKPERLRKELGQLVERLLQENGTALNAMERRHIVQDIQDEVMGLGPLEALLADPTVSDILVNGPTQVYVERYGKLEKTSITFSDDEHLMKIIDKIVSRVGRRVDESSPMVDARLPDGSRVNAIIAPLALDGPLLSIRRFAVVPLKMDDLIAKRSLTPALAKLLSAMVRAKVNVLISGGTGTGKTTLLNVLSSSIPPDERIVTIEDAAELQLQQPHVVRLETRPPNIEDKGEVSQRALMRNSLRMRPDRIILGEVRGAEVLDMLQAMNTGHEGSMATVHANSPRDALTRLENMAGYGGAVIPQEAMRQQVSSAIDAVIQIARLNDGSRKLISLQEITGMEGDIITMQEIYHFKQTGIDADGTVKGHFRALGVRPKFMDRLKAYGLSVADDTFDPSLIYE
ncbi:CpaF family protein [Polaromonas sp.]|uniref:CpaF family protein n=1 Tax=Polaromonas sp. TaxID=1869339 RepID=UPI003FA73905